MNYQIEESPTHSIQICESLLEETPSANPIDCFEKFDVSRFHVDSPKEDIGTSIIEE